LALHYIAIEGVIGVGKTSLALILADRLNGRLILEQPEENPFLEDFYEDPRRFAFQTQLFFLLNRYRQQQEFGQLDLFHQIVVSDYLFAKDRIFACLNLERRELVLYEKIMALLERGIPRPDLVIYLQSSTERLMANIRRRGRSYEKKIDESYLRALNEEYNRFFLRYDEAPVLVVNATEIDFVNNPEEREDLVRRILRPHSGIEFYTPQTTSQR